MDILNVTGGTVPKQAIIIKDEYMKLRTSEKGQRTYLLKEAIVSVERLKKKRGTTDFVLILRDNERIEGSTSDKILSVLEGYVGQSHGLNFIVEEVSEKELKRQDRNAGIKIFLATVVAIIFLAYCSNEDSVPNNLPLGRYSIIGDGHYGCASKEYFSKTIQMIAQEDKAGFAKLYRLGLATKQCRKFSNGENVILVQAGLAKVKIRKEGEVAEYWTVMEAIKQ